MSVKCAMKSDILSLIPPSYLLAKHAAALLQGGHVFELRVHEADLARKVSGYGHILELRISK